MGTGVVDGHGSGGQNNGSFKFALVQISAEPRAPKTLKTFQHKIPPVSGALLIMSSRSEKKKLLPRVGETCQYLKGNL